MVHAEEETNDLPWVEFSVEQRAASGSLQHRKMGAQDLEPSMKAVAEARSIEDQLHQAEKGRVRALAARVERQVLQTRTVGLDDVRRDAERWKALVLKEYKSLIVGPVKVITKDDVEAMRKGGHDLEILPTKAVAWP